MRTDEDYGELELSDYVAILRRRWPWLLAPLLLVPALALLFTLRQDDVYSATARVLLAESAAQEAVDGGINNTSARARELNNEINLARSDDAEASVRQLLGLDDDDPLPSGTITADSTSDVLEFQFEASTPENAATIANTWAEAYVALKQSDAAASITATVNELEATLQELRDERAAVRADLEALEDRLARASEEARPSLQLQVDREASAISGELGLIDAQIAANIQSITRLELSGELAATGTARVFQRAAPPLSPTNAPASRNLVLGVLVGLILGAALALLVENLDQTVKTSDDIQRLGFNTLGAIPKPSKNLRRLELAMVGLTNPDSSVADAYQKVRTALQFTAIEGNIKSFVVTSPNQGDGKTTTSVNLAIAFSSIDQRVVLVDSDLRRPRVHSVFNTSLVPGITDSLLDEIPLADIAVRTADSPDTLAALPAGTQPPNPATFLSSKMFHDLATDLTQSADLVVYDAPPVLAVADALSVSQHADGVVLVTFAGKTKRDDLQHAAQNIASAGSKLLGVVIVGVKDSGRYGQYYSDEVHPAPGRSAPVPASTERGPELDTSPHSSDSNRVGSKPAPSSTGRDKMPTAKRNGTAKASTIKGGSKPKATASADRRASRRGRTGS